MMFYEDEEFNKGISQCYTSKNFRITSLQNMKKIIYIASLVGVMTTLFCYTSFAAEAIIDLQKPKTKAIPQYTISITKPQSDETLQNDTQELTVDVSITPELEKEDTVAIYVDGIQNGEAINNTSITIPPLERGSHTLQAKITQPKGKGAESNVITIFQHRHSKLLP
jgi:hypothetical protein